MNMLRLLEIAWLSITLICFAGIVYKLFNEGWEDAVWLTFATLFTFVMFMIRRRQRIRYQAKNENELYH
jgi:hypothetical protein